MSKPVVASAVAALLAVTPSRPVKACGVPDFGQALADAANAFVQHDQTVVAPEVVVGGWPGSSSTLDAGVAWGTKTTGFLGGLDLHRVLVATVYDTPADRHSLGVTYGRLGSIDPWGFALDAGVLGDRRGAGPTARVQLGIAGVSLRLSGDVIVGGPKTDLDGRAEVVLDMAALAHGT